MGAWRSMVFVALPFVAGAILVAHAVGTAGRSALKGRSRWSLA